METEASLIDFAPVFKQIIPLTELDRLAAGQEQLPDNYGVRVAVITTRPDINLAEKDLLLRFVRLTHSYKEGSQLDSDIRESCLSEKFTQIATQEEAWKKSPLRHVFFVVTFGMINGGNWASLVEQAYKDSKEEARHQEEERYAHARRRANRAYEMEEKALFLRGKYILSPAGKALFDRLGDRRETRPRYKLGSKHIPA